MVEGVVVGGVVVGGVVVGGGVHTLRLQPPTPKKPPLIHK